MKTLLTTLLLVLAQSVIVAQDLASADESESYAIIYSEDEEALVYKDTSDTQGKDIVIESIPGFDKVSIPVVISQNKKGSYTFKKHPTLFLPEYYSVVIEDNLTGNVFDLQSADSYSFSVNRAMPDRFVLLITKKKTTFTASR
jgi:hypothetical protein